MLYNLVDIVKQNDGYEMTGRYCKVQKKCKKICPLMRIKPVYLLSINKTENETRTKFHQSEPILL